DLPQPLLDTALPTRCLGFRRLRLWQGDGTVSASDHGALLLPFLLLVGGGDDPAEEDEHDRCDQVRLPVGSQQRQDEEGDAEDEQQATQGRLWHQLIQPEVSVRRSRHVARAKRTSAYAASTPISGRTSIRPPSARTRSA